MTKERILITVKTYPTLSSKYDEVVCTAGLKEDGTWIRIYPIPFRKLDVYEQFKKYDWVEIDIERNSADIRHESYRPKSEINVLRNVDTSNDWLERRSLVLSNGTVFTSFEEILELNKNNHGLSLATFKPTEIIDFTVEADSREWDKDKLQAVELRATQTDLFRDSPKYFKVVKKLPYKFRYVFKDDTGKVRKMMIGDWEIGALYWNELKRYNGSEIKAIESVKNKYFNQLINGRDIHFFVGTNQSWDLKNVPNPFMIIGVFSPPIVFQNELF